MLPLLLLAADPETAVEAEHAMEQAAQAEGHWAAVNRFAEADAMVLSPDPKPVAKAYPLDGAPRSYRWTPSDSYVACDDSAAVNTGPWRGGGHDGYFTTVWKRQADARWKWSLDSGDRLAAPRPWPAETHVHRASCRFQRSSNPNFATMSAPEGPGHGRSADGTLLWDWYPEADGRWSLTVRLWNGRSLDVVLHDRVPERMGEAQ